MPISVSFDLTTIIAVAGFCISIANSYWNWEGRRLAREQEKRRLPQLVPFLINGYFQNKTNDGGRDYAFLVTIRNPTDSNNAIAEVDLSITYLTTDRIQMTMKIKANEPLVTNFVKGQDERLPVPSSVSAHNTISGWILFHLPAPMLGGMDIESYRLIFTDTHREAASVVPILVQEYRDET